MRLRLAAALLFLATTTTLLAQTPGPCRDPFGNFVPAFANAYIPDVAIATWSPQTGPIIYYQPNVAFSPGAVSTFVYYHECGHHALGHVLGFSRGIPGPPSMEIDADCYAMATLAQLGLTQRDFALIAGAFYYNPAKPPYYPDGPTRVAYMQACLRNRGIQLPN
ncbi:MAG TPA: hypothetical protein VFN10_00955 [Thermoanaerobaculia bacterium]|nr:hypothetical protein [Thermoanaerobaculia bacterium]